MNIFIQIFIPKYPSLSIGKIIADEISRLTTSYENNAREKNELIEEKEKLLSHQEKGKKSLIKQINDMDIRIDKISVFIKGEEALLGSARGEEKSGDIRKRNGALQDAKQSLDGYEGHKEELNGRLQSGVLSQDALSRLMDIQDELETVEAEMNTNKSRLKDEQTVLSIHNENFTDKTKGDFASAVKNQENDHLFNMLFNLHKKLDLNIEISDMYSGQGIGSISSHNERISTPYYLLAHISKSLIESKYQALSSTGNVHI